MPKVKVNDIQIYYEIKGEGFPLVMIMGLGENLDGWNPRLVEELSRKFKLVMFDNRGAGRTDVSDRKYTIKLFADDTAGLMDALGISKAHVLGISMGGMIAQELVLNHPEKVAKLVLCSTLSQWGGFNQDVSRLMLAMREGASSDELTRIILSFDIVSDFPSDFVKKNPFVVSYCTSDFAKENPDSWNNYMERAAKHPISQEAYKRQMNAAEKFNAHDRLQQIKVPTLVLQGRKDFGLPPKSGSILAEAIPNAKLVCFEKSNHYLVEEMNEVTNSIMDFLG
jgi:pimeloyl-ACP methyl ester carboxylesterase